MKSRTRLMRRTRATTVPLLIIFALAAASLAAPAKRTASHGGVRITFDVTLAREATAQTVPVTMERDTEPRVITPPADFARALKSNKDAQATWDKLSYTHRREHVEHIEEAKKPETRLRRIEKSVAALAAGRKEPR